LFLWACGVETGMAQITKVFFASFCSQKEAFRLALWPPQGAHSVFALAFAAQYRYAGRENFRPGIPMDRLPRSREAADPSLLLTVRRFYVRTEYPQRRHHRPR
jgi:hypothetical protein